MNALLRSLDVASRQNPKEFAADMFESVIAFTSYLSLRLQYSCVHLIAGDDRARRGPPALSRVLTEQLLPQLMELNRHLVEMAETQASTARLWELATSKSLENQQHIRQSDRKKRSSRIQSSQVNGHTGTQNSVNRLAGILPSNEPN
jgi:hypothetical protein